MLYVHVCDTNTCYYINASAYVNVYVYDIVIHRPVHVYNIMSSHVLNI